MIKNITKRFRILRCFDPDKILHLLISFFAFLFFPSLTIVAEDVVVVVVALTAAVVVLNMSKKIIFVNL